jgi:RNA polymerase sigma-70 factor (ECF subfamily)
MECELITTCRVALPELDVDPSAFVAYVRERCPDGVATPHAVDLYLAFACREGQPRALQVFDRTFGTELDRALRGRDTRAAEDAKQILRQRLFVGPPPKIAAYSGHGPLKRWLRVVARRILLEVVENREPIADEWEIAALPVAGDDPELAYFKARYRADYKHAFETALAALDPRARTVLAQYHVDGLTVDQLGALYAVHRATASRWVTEAQKQVGQRTLALLRERLGLSPEDLGGVTRLVRSQLTLSLSRLLAVTPRIG